jgi:glycosyltransferase involved in cell wall biosynthesis
MIVITNWRDLDHPEAGGAEVVCQELAQRLAGAGASVVLLCAAVSGAPSTEVRDGYRILRAGGRFTVYAHALTWLFRHRSEVAAVIDSQNGIPFFTPLAVKRRTPVLMLLHHIHQEQFDKYFPRPVAAVGRWLESTASRSVYGRRAVVTVSPSTRIGARQSLGLAGEIWVAPPGWAVTEEVRQSAATRTENPSVVCVGRLVPHKRTDLVVQAFPSVLRRHPEATLTIVGRGPELPRLQSLAATTAASSRIRFETNLDDAGRDLLMSSAWLTVNASQGEGWGLSVLEANALGVPALAFRRPGLRDSIVDGETGWLIDDNQNLATAISDCLLELADLGRARQVSHHARQWAAGFTWERMAERVSLALNTEDARLSRGPADRRRRSDLATVVSLHAHDLPEQWQDALRSSDLWEAHGDAVTLLLRGADTQAARSILERMGVSDDALADDVRISVARTSDILRLPRAEFAAKAAVR